MRPSVTTYVSEGPRVYVMLHKKRIFRYSLESLIFHSCIYPSSHAVLTNKCNFFTGLRFEVEQASHCLLVTHRHSIGEQDGCFQWRLFVCLSVCLFVFVNMITSQRLNIGRWNLVVKCIVQKSRLSSNLGVIGPWFQNVAVCWVTAQKNQQTIVGMAGVAVGHATTSVSK